MKHWVLCHECIYTDLCRLLTRISTLIRGHDIQVKTPSLGTVKPSAQAVVTVISRLSTSSMRLMQ